MLIDTHIHLYSPKFDPDREDVVRRAREAGVEMMVLPAIDVASIRKSVELAARHRGIRAMAAIHPSEAAGAGEAELAAVRKWCDHPSVVAVGESGLDYYWDRTFDDAQRYVFRQLIRIAIEKDLPLILHSRDKQGRTEVYEDIVRILREERSETDRPGSLRGIFHCFGGPDWLPAEAADLNFLLGIGGTLTFRNSGVASILEAVPMEQLVLETDGPYLAPEPFRGKRNEPAYVRLVAEKLAEVKGVSVEETARITTENAKRIYGI